ncbi:MAG: HesA/MoeB/ThiF family protein [Anaerolineales bacterium]|nr:HesA/MoeB/ThiF family protein [Anaerolineales bacterium]
MQMERYTRQMDLRKIGKRGQARLTTARAVIIGCGGLGSVSAELLARAGIGHLRLVDDDRVEFANLVGQTLFDEEDARTGKHKVIAAWRRLRHINLDVAVEPVIARLNERNADSLVTGADLVLDGSDNDATRYLINAVCIRQSIPWVFAAVLENYGLIMNIVPGKTPCFVCIFGCPDQQAYRNKEKGALAATTHAVASLQVSQALRLLLRDGKTNQGLIYVDTWQPGVEIVPVKGPPTSCPACGRGEGCKALDPAPIRRLSLP